jgi:thiol:disulfide interchange protein
VLCPLTDLQALAAASSVFDVRGRQVRLQVETGESGQPADGQGVAFYPLSKRLIDPTAPVETTTDGGRVRLTLSLHARQQAAPESVDGVLIVSDSDRRRAYQVAASPAHLVGPASFGAGDDLAQSLPLVLLLAMLGGLALNLMPCVFPVLMLKPRRSRNLTLFRSRKRIQEMHGSWGSARCRQ